MHIPICFSYLSMGSPEKMSCTCIWMLWNRMNSVTWCARQGEGPVPILDISRYTVFLFVVIDIFLLLIVPFFLVNPSRTDSYIYKLKSYKTSQFLFLQGNRITLTLIITKKVYFRRIVRLHYALKFICTVVENWLSHRTTVKFCYGISLSTIMKFSFFWM